MQIPRLIGFSFDLVHDIGWKPYLLYLKNEKVVSAFVGRCQFLCDPDCRSLLEEPLEVLRIRGPSTYASLKETERLSFILQGEFPDYSRAACLKFRIPKNAIEKGVDGILSSIGFGYVHETEVRKRGMWRYRIMPPRVSEIKPIWVDWMEGMNINPALVDFYRTADLTRGG